MNPEALVYSTLNRSLSVVLAVLVIAAAACGTSESESDPTTTDPAPVVAESTATITSATTTTALVTTTSAAAPAVSWPEPGEQWDLIYISSSYGRDVAGLLAEHAEEALGVTVNAHDATFGHLGAPRALSLIQDIGYPPLGDLIRDAEIIVVHGMPWDTGVDTEWETCHSNSETERTPPKSYTEDDWQPYRDVLDQIYAEIWQLRQGAPTVLRAVDFYNGRISDQRAAGIAAECTAAYESQFAAVRSAAEENGAVYVSLYDIFNGPGHDEDPRDKGWIRGDGIHHNPTGAAVIAETIAGAGFEPGEAPD